MPETRRIDDAAPWKERYRAPSVLWSAMAKDHPERGLVASNKSGVYQLYAWDVPTGNLTTLTDHADGMVFGYLSADGRYVYYHDDRQGNEIGHYLRVPFEGGAPHDVTPDLPPYASFSLALSRAANLIAFTMADKDGFHLCALDLATDATPGAPRMLYHSPTIAMGPALSYDGDIAVMASTEQSGQLHFSLVALDVVSGATIGELSDGPGSSVEPGPFAPRPGDAHLAATTNRSGVKRPLIWNARTGERTDLALDDVEGEVAPLDWSPDGQSILLRGIRQAVEQLYLYDLTNAQATRLHHPGGTVSGAYFGPDGHIFATWADSTHPRQVIALDGATGQQTRVVLAAGEAPPSHPWTSITFTSSDGQQIQGWLALPTGEGPFPTILETHGGPTAVTTEGFSPGSQAWLDHGFAFLTVNYRGSTTFGKAFEEQIWGDFGHWEVEDMVAARDYLLRHGIAREDKIFLTGWSYGGYLTLQALGVYPDLWAGGMAGIAIADWAVQYEDSADTLRGYQRAIFGGTPREKPEQYRASSPITYVERVTAPVLIIQGRNDTRTPARPIALYEEKMKGLGKPIEVHWFDSGHLGSFTQVERSIEHQETMLRFAQRILG